MKIIQVADKSDPIYPLDQTTYYDPYVVYHGTRSVFTEKIMNNGWTVNAQSYDIDDIKEICNAYESIGYWGEKGEFGYSNLSSFTIGDEDKYIKRKAASFTTSYWTARNYSGYVGGETIKNVLAAINGFSRLVENEELIKSHEQNLYKKSQKHFRKIKLFSQPSVKGADKAIECEQIDLDKVMKQLEILRERSYLKKSAENFSKIKEKYQQIYQENGFPVVFAIRIRKEWFSDWKELHYKDLGIEALDLHANSDIPAENIIARINFTNGVKRFDPYHKLPLPWKRADEKWNDLFM